MPTLESKKTPSSSRAAPSPGAISRRAWRSQACNRSPSRGSKASVITLVLFVAKICASWAEADARMATAPSAPSTGLIMCCGTDRAACLFPDQRVTVVEPKGMVFLDTGALLAARLGRCAPGAGPGSARAILLTFGEHFSQHGGAPGDGGAPGGGSMRPHEGTGDGRAAPPARGRTAGPDP